eukprot:TRINITY_DN15350_c0_g1_i3.p1 TRINITY_DN15350_c0_g1~~TRINITY_DN15350_c0_g1_i3.p1  ORF type:complete len:108 (+),score=9.25 TRINITY_DN15350_c0_g1_i3:379-702(+)
MTSSTAGNKVLLYRLLRRNQTMLDLLWLRLAKIPSSTHYRTTGLCCLANIFIVVGVVQQLKVFHFFLFVPKCHTHKKDYNMPFHKCIFIRIWQLGLKKKRGVCLAEK